MQIKKENYYKLFTENNKLLLVSPKWENIIERINELDGTSYNYMQISKPSFIGSQRFVGDYRIVKEQI